MVNSRAFSAAGLCVCVCVLVNSHKTTRTRRIDAAQRHQPGGLTRARARVRTPPRAPAVARLPREQTGTVSIASGAHARRAVRAGAANAERGRALGAGRVGARASAPFGPGQEGESPPARSAICAPGSSPAHKMSIPRRPDG